MRAFLPGLVSVCSDGFTFDVEEVTLFKRKVLIHSKLFLEARTQNKINYTVAEQRKAECTGETRVPKPSTHLLNSEPGMPVTSNYFEKKSIYNVQG